MARVTYRIDGPEGAPVLVLANSLGTTWAMWEPQLAAFSGRFRVLRYDHPGHGTTPAVPGPYRIEQLGADVLGLLDDIGEERASLCGLSIGGTVAMWLAAHAPERVDRLVVVLHRGRRSHRPSSGGSGPRRCGPAALASCAAHSMASLVHSRLRGTAARCGRHGRRHAGRVRPRGLRRLLRGHRRHGPR